MEVAITKTKINLVSLRIIIIMTSRSNITERSEVSAALAEEEEEEVLVVIVLIEAVEEEEEQVATTIITTKVTTFMKKVKDIVAVEEAGLIKGLIMKKKM